MSTTQTVKIDYGNWFAYKALYEITEYRAGCVYKTKFIKYVKNGYPSEPHQILNPLSTTVLGKEISIESP